MSTFHHKFTIIFKLTINNMQEAICLFVTQMALKIDFLCDCQGKNNMHDEICFTEQYARTFMLAQQCSTKGLSNKDQF